MMDVLILITMIVLSVVSVTLIIGSFLSLKRVRERHALREMVVDGYYNYLIAVEMGMVDKDESMEDLDFGIVAYTVKDYLGDGIFLTKDHISNQELFDKLKHYYDMFKGVNLRSMYEKEVRYEKMYYDYLSETTKEYRNHDSKEGSSRLIN